MKGSANIKTISAYLHMVIALINVQVCLCERYR